MFSIFDLCLFKENSFRLLRKSDVVGPSNCKTKTENIFQANTAQIFKTKSKTRPRPLFLQDRQFSISFQTRSLRKIPSLSTKNFARPTENGKKQFG